MRFREALAVVLLLAATTVAAQESRGAVSGLVKDSQGAVLPGARVTVVNVDTNSTTHVTTTGSGQYSALYLNPGTYTVTVELQNFRTYRREVPVGVAQKVQLDVTMETGGMTEDIVVTAERPLLESGSATMGQSMTSHMARNLRGRRRDGRRGHR